MYVGIDTPGQDYPATQRVHLATEGVITEDREGEERFTSVGDRVYCELHTHTHTHTHTHRQTIHVFEDIFALPIQLSQRPL